MLFKASNPFPCWSPNHFHVLHQTSWFCIGLFPMIPANSLGWQISYSCCNVQLLLAGRETALDVINAYSCWALQAATDFLPCPGAAAAFYSITEASSVLFDTALYPPVGYYWKQCHPSAVTSSSISLRRHVSPLLPESITDRDGEVCGILLLHDIRSPPSFTSFISCFLSRVFEQHTYVLLHFIMNNTLWDRLGCKMDCIRVTQLCGDLNINPCVSSLCLHPTIQCFVI